MTCPHGVSLDDDCQGCQSDAESAAEEAAWALLPKEEQDRLIAEYAAADELWYESLTPAQKEAYTILEADHEAWLKEQE